MNGLEPNARTAATTPPPGSEACGCCEGVEPVTPRSHANRHGLSAVAYRIGLHAHFRESLLAGLSQADHAPLGALRTRDPDDFTIGLVDAFACSADVLTFYQERIANESWLRTATERTSLQELAKLIGYRLRPGVAAETWLAFALEAPRLPPANAPVEPGAFVTGIPAQVRLDAGLKVQSVPGQDEAPQTFETVETIEARPEWNAMRPWTSIAHPPGAGDRAAWLDGVDTALKPGDAVVLSDAASWQFRILSEVVAEPNRNRTRVAWTAPLAAFAGSGALHFHALRLRASVFGHNAPMWRTMPEAFRTAYEDTSTDFGLEAMARRYDPWGVTRIGVVDDWPDFVISPVHGQVDLDAAYPSIAPDSWIVLANTGHVARFRVTSVSDGSRDAFALSGKSTRVGLAGDGYDAFAGDVRGTRIFAQSEALPFAGRPVVDDVAGGSIPVAVAGPGLETGRRLVVQGTTHADVAVVHQAVVTGVRAAGAHAWLDITPPLPSPLSRESVRVAGNVALARHGETVTQLLGSGDAAKPHARYELKHLPLTWRAAPTAVGAASELTVRVDGVAWKERPTLYGSGPRDRAYVLEVDELARHWLVFGDGHDGARVPTGVNNLRATYRKGIGRDGNVRAETLTQLMTRPLGLKSAANPGPARGGTDPEPAAQARAAMPLATRTLGRAVSLLDYEDFARAYTGIAKARASVLQLRHGPAIGITIAGQDGAALDADNPIRHNLLAALRANGDPRVDVRLLDAVSSPFRIGLKVRCDPAREVAPVLAAVEAALRTAFSFDARGLGQPVQQSEVFAVVHAVPGVVAMDLDLLYGGTAPVAQTLPSLQARLLASRMHVVDGVPVAAEVLVLHPGALDRLEPMP